MDRSTLVRAGAPVAVFGAVLGAVLVLGRGGQSFPRPLPLAAAGTAGKTEDAAAAPAMYGGEIHIADGLLDGLPERGPAYDLDGVTRERVAALAKALGVEGSVQEKDGAYYVEENVEVLLWVDRHTGRWVLGPDKGITAGVNEPKPWTGEVDEVATATAGPIRYPVATASDVPEEKPAAEPTPVCLAPDRCGPTAPPPPDSGFGSSSSGSSGSGTIACQPATPQPCAVATLAPPAHPTDDAVRDALAKVMAVTGQEDANVTIEAGYLGTDGFADPVVDGLPTFGYRTVVTLETPATVVRGSGFLVTPERVASYPLLSPREAVERVGGGAIGIMEPYPAPSAVATPAPREATTVRLGLMYMPSFEPDAAGYLAPAWLLSFEGVSFEEPFLALPDRYVATPPPPTGKPDDPVCSPEPCGETVPGAPPSQVDPATPPITVFE